MARPVTPQLILQCSNPLAVISSPPTWWLREQPGSSSPAAVTAARLPSPSLRTPTGLTGAHQLLPLSFLAPSSFSCSSSLPSSSPPLLLRLQLRAKFQADRRWESWAEEEGQLCTGMKGGTSILPRPPLHPSPSPGPAGSLLSLGILQIRPLDGGKKCYSNIRKDFFPFLLKSETKT